MGSTSHHSNASNCNEYLRREFVEKTGAWAENLRLIGHAIRSSTGFFLVEDILTQISKIYVVECKKYKTEFVSKCLPQGVGPATHLCPASLLNKASTTDPVETAWRDQCLQHIDMHKQRKSLLAQLQANFPEGQVIQSKMYGYIRLDRPHSHQKNRFTGFGSDGERYSYAYSNLYLSELQQMLGQ